MLLTVKIDQLAAQKRTMSYEEQVAFRKPTLDKYEKEGSPYYSTARLWDDGIIDPADTRKVLALGLAAAANKEIPEPVPGVYRM